MHGGLSMILQLDPSTASGGQLSCKADLCGDRDRTSLSAGKISVLMLNGSTECSKSAFAAEPSIT